MNNCNFCGEQNFDDCKVCPHCVFAKQRVIEAVCRATTPDSPIRILIFEDLGLK